MEINTILDFMKRYLLLFILFFCAVYFLNPDNAVLRTLMIIVSVECLAITLSAFAAYTYTKLDFINQSYSKALSNIFLGVHLCTGLTILGVYLAQY